MRRSLWVALLAAQALAACLGPSVSPSETPDPRRDEGGGLGASGVRVDVVAEGLEVPWGLAFAPDDRILVTERPGRVRVIMDGTLQAEPVAVIQEVSASSEAGLLGIALDPAFASNDLVYIMYSYGGGGQPLLNRVVRFTLAGGADDSETLIDGIQGATFHDGGRIKFGPDGKLYVTTGDAGNQAAAQLETSPNGKILRVNADGSVPTDNPIPGNALWSKGHRNPQGIAWDDDGRLWATEHGPSGFDGPGGFDELNLIEKGWNYGWPEKYCGNSRAPVTTPSTDPVACYEQAIAPAGLAIVPHDRYPGWEGSLFFGTLRGQHLHRVLVGDPDAREDEMLYVEEFGRIRDVVLGPDGWLYFTTSNRDGRGNPQDGDDRVMRIVVAP